MTVVIGYKNEVYKTTDEMSEKEFLDFRAAWYRYTMRALLSEGATKEEAGARARKRFKAMKKTGFREVNETRTRNHGIRLATLRKKALEKMTKKDTTCGK